MVTARTLEKYLSMSQEIAAEAGTKPEVATSVIRAIKDRIMKAKRQPAPPPPEGGISLSAASRKYGIPQQTISRWANKGKVPVVLRTNRELYVSEKALAEVARRYKENPGQGKRTIN